MPKKETTEPEKKHRKHDPKWADHTHKQRDQKRTQQDNDWANRVSGGKYPTLRRLMTAIHKGYKPDL